MEVQRERSRGTFKGREFTLDTLPKDKRNFH